MVLKAVLFTIGALALLESLLIFIFPKWMTEKVKKITKNKKKMKKAAFIELVVALILILIASLV